MSTTVRLPSGNVAVLRRPRPPDILERKGFSADLVAAAAKGNPDPIRGSEMVDVIVSTAFVRPRVVLEGEARAGALHVDDINDEEQGRRYRLDRAKAALGGIGVSIGETTADAPD